MKQTQVTKADQKRVRARELARSRKRIAAKLERYQQSAAPELDNLILSCEKMIGKIDRELETLR